VPAVVKGLEPGGAVALLEDPLKAVAVGVGDRVDGVLDDVARLCATPRALGLRLRCR
jgi:hypothetical protein